MNKKRSSLIFGLLLLTFVGVLFIWTQEEKIPHISASKFNALANQASVNHELKPLLPEIEKIRQLEKTEPEKAKTLRHALIEKLPEKYKRYYQAGFKSGMQDVNFYGRIVDQYGEPVMGAKVTYGLGGAFLAPGKGMGQTVTDAEGRFEIHNEGGSLSLDKVEHPDIDFQYPLPTVNTDSSLLWPKNLSMSFYGYQPTQGGGEALWTDTTSDTPYVFTAWRVENYEDVLTGNINGYYVPDGRIYTLNFEGRQFKERKIEGIADGHLRVSCTRGPMQHHRDWVDWQVTLSPVEGGIQITDDLYMNLAPESGYQPSLTIETRTDSPNYKQQLRNQRYFFTAHNGQVHGSLFLHIDPHIYDTSSQYGCRININYFKVNTSSSRNLAVKPKY